MKLNILFVYSLVSFYEVPIRVLFHFSIELSVLLSFWRVLHILWAWPFVKLNTLFVYSLAIHFMKCLLEFFSIFLLSCLFYHFGEFFIYSGHGPFVRYYVLQVSSQSLQLFFFTLVMVFFH